MATSILDFVGAVAEAAASTERYGTKTTPVAADLLYLGDSADATVTNETKLITWAAVQAVDSSITKGTLATATGARVANFGSNSLTLDSITTLDVNHSGLAHFQGDAGLKLSGASSGAPGKLIIADNDSSHAVTHKAPATITANYDVIWLSALPGAEELLTIDNLGNVSTTTLITSSAGFRGGHDASGGVYPEVGGAEPPEIRSGDAILAGDHFDIAVAGTLGGTPVNRLDSLYAKINSPGQTSSNWGIIAAPSAPADTSITAGTLATATNDRSPDFGNQNVNFNNAASITFNSTNTVKVVSDSGLTLDATSGATPGRLVLENSANAHQVTIETALDDVNSETYTLKLPNKTPTSVTEMVTMDTTGALSTQTIPAGGGTNTHIFNDSLADLAANVSHNMKGFKVQFVQNVAGGGMRWNNATDGFGVKDGVPRVIGTNGNWWTIGITALGEFTSTDTTLSAF